MTREESIKMLKSKMDGNTDTSYEWAETVRMAIKALEQEPCKTLSRIEYGLDGNLYELSISGGTNKALEQEPCEDCINRQAVLDEISDYNNDLDYTTNELYDRVKRMSSVTSHQKTGHWINVNEGKWNTIPAYKCSECGANADLRDWSGKSPFCPWCGTKMVESQESEGKE